MKLELFVLEVLLVAVKFLNSKSREVEYIVNLQSLKKSERLPRPNVYVQLPCAWFVVYLLKDIFCVSVVCEVNWMEEHQYHWRYCWTSLDEEPPSNHFVSQMKLSVIPDV